MSDAADLALDAADAAAAQPNAFVPGTAASFALRGAAAATVTALEGIVAADVAAVAKAQQTTAETVLATVDAYGALARDTAALAEMQVALAVLDAA